MEIKNQNDTDFTNQLIQKISLKRGKSVTMEGSKTFKETWVIVFSRIFLYNISQRKERRENGR